MGHTVREMDPRGEFYPYSCSSIATEKIGKIAIMAECELNMKIGPEPHDELHTASISIGIGRKVTLLWSDE